MAARKAVNKKAEKIVNEVKRLCSRLFKEKLHDVYLYGSYARGDFDRESDIDILLTLSLSDEELIRYRKIMSFIGSRLGLRYDIMVSIIMVPLERFTKFSDDLPFYKNVISEGVNYGLN